MPNRSRNLSRRAFRLGTRGVLCRKRDRQFVALPGRSLRSRRKIRCRLAEGIAHLQVLRITLGCPVPAAFRGNTAGTLQFRGSLHALCGTPRNVQLELNLQKRPLRVATAALA